MCPSSLSSSETLLETAEATLGFQEYAAVGIGKNSHHLLSPGSKAVDKMPAVMGVK